MFIILKLYNLADLVPAGPNETESFIRIFRLQHFWKQVPECRSLSVKRYKLCSIGDLFGTNQPRSQGTTYSREKPWERGWVQTISENILNLKTIKNCFLFFHSIYIHRTHLIYFHFISLILCVLKFTVFNLSIEKIMPWDPCSYFIHYINWLRFQRG